MTLSLRLVLAAFAPAALAFAQTGVPTANVIAGGTTAASPALASGASGLVLHEIYEVPSLAPVAASATGPTAAVSLRGAQ